MGDVPANRPTVITVDDRMQSGFEYVLSEPEGQHFDDTFSPELTPQQMLEMGVFGGKYMTDCKDEFPSAWFKNAKLSPVRAKIELNYFGVAASQPLAEWERKGWIYCDDPRGWFQWYCRYFMGRRGPDDDRQIKRWRAMRRHIAQVVKNCPPGALDCRKKQRQALLHWAYDSRKL